MSHNGPNSNPDWVDATFALFILAEVSNDEVKKILQEAHDGSTVDCYFFWLADDFSTAPREHRDEDGTTTFDTGTEPPIAKDWVSPSAGKTAEDCAGLLKNMPADLNLCLDYHYFAVLDADYAEIKLLKIYPIGDEDLVGEELDCVTCSVRGSSLFLSAMEPHYWEETKATCEDGEPVG